MYPWNPSSLGAAEVAQYIDINVQTRARPQLWFSLEEHTKNLRVLPSSFLELPRSCKVFNFIATFALEFSLSD